MADRHSTVSFFFFNDPPTAEIYTLSLHDALPICRGRRIGGGRTIILYWLIGVVLGAGVVWALTTDRKSTRLNSSHVEISYAVFCLKKKNAELRLRLVYESNTITFLIEDAVVSATE